MFSKSLENSQCWIISNPDIVEIKNVFYSFNCYHLFTLIRVEESQLLGWMTDLGVGVSVSGVEDLGVLLLLSRIIFLVWNSFWRAWDRLERAFCLLKSGSSPGRGCPIRASCPRPNFFKPDSNCTGLVWMRGFRCNGIPKWDGKARDGLGRTRFAANVRVLFWNIFFNYLTLLINFIIYWFINIC